MKKSITNAAKNWVTQRPFFNGVILMCVMALGDTYSGYSKINDDTWPVGFVLAAGLMAYFTYDQRDSFFSPLMRGAALGLTLSTAVQLAAQKEWVDQAISTIEHASHELSGHVKPDQPLSVFRNGPLLMLNP